MLNWISFKYGFGTYLHLIDGYYSKATHEQANNEMLNILDRFKHHENQVYVDTIISPSYTSAIAQAIQIPGISGMENNMIIFDYDKQTKQNLGNIIDNFSLVRSGNFDVCILASTGKHIEFENGIHVWIKSSDTYNANLMILLSFIILGHPDWHKSTIKIFEICNAGEEQTLKTNYTKWLLAGACQLPIITLK